MDSLSDTFINAFSRVRKPDARFVEMGENLERFEEGLASVERLMSRSKNRVEDLANDYQDMAAAYQGLGYLESGITEPLNRFAEKMLDFSALLRHQVSYESDEQHQVLMTEREYDRAIPSPSPFAPSLYCITPRGPQAARPKAA